MYAVLMEVNVTGVDREAGLKGLREHVVPAIKHLPGFQSGVWLPGDADGKALSVTVWQTEAHARMMTDRFGSGSSPQAGATIEHWEVREVAATA
jgi:hypothetical protein